MVRMECPHSGVRGRALRNHQDFPLVEQHSTKHLKKHELKTMDVTFTIQLNELSAYITRELHRSERPQVLWELYCGKARTLEVAESLGMEVSTFFYDTS